MKEREEDEKKTETIDKTADCRPCSTDASGWTAGYGKPGGSGSE